MEPVTFFVFASPEKFTPEQEKELLNSVNEFLKNWKSHGVPVQAKANIEYGHFLTVEILPGSEIPGGCSKDELFRLIGKIENENKLSLLDRKFIYLWDSTNRNVFTVKLSDIGNFLSESKKIRVFDTSVTDANKWKMNPIPIENSWLTALVSERE
jgi:hypothetical protein